MRLPVPQIHPVTIYRCYLAIPDRCSLKNFVAPQQHYRSFYGKIHGSVVDFADYESTGVEASIPKFAHISSLASEQNDQQPDNQGGYTRDQTNGDNI